MRFVRAIFPAVALAAFLGMPGALGQTPPAGGAGFTITSIAPYMAPKRPLELTVTVANTSSLPLTDATIRITVHDHVFSRSELRAALDGIPRADVLAVATEEIEPLQPGERKQLHISRDLADLANRFHSSNGDGVYPMDVDLRVAGETRQQASTAIPFFFEPPKVQLNIVWLLPVHRSAAFDGRGRYQAASIDRDVAKGGTLETLARALERHPDFPVTLAPTGMTFDQVADLADGFATIDRNGEQLAIHPSDQPAADARAWLADMSRIAGTHAFQLATATYSRADLIGMTQAGMNDEIQRQFSRNTDRVRAALGRAPEQGLLVPGDGALDARTATSIASLGFSTVVLAPEALPERLSRFGYDRAVTVTGGGGVSLTALIEDPAIRDRLAAPAGPVLDVQGALAETASSYFELPSVANKRVIVIGTPSMPDGPTVRGVMDAVASAPWLHTISALGATTAEDLRPVDEPIPLPAPVAAGPVRAPLVAAREARRTLSTLAKVLGDEGQPEQLDRLVLAAESADWIANPQPGSVLARAARGIAERTLAGIRVPGRQVTLTSRIAQIPVTVQNDTGQPVRVRIRLDSTKVSFPDGDEQTLDVPTRFETVTFRAETRVTGSFPLTVSIETPDGADTVGTGTIIVRSTAVSAVTLLATGGGVLLLVLSWIRRVLKERKLRAAG